MKIDHARRIASGIIRQLQPYTERIDIAGSIRRNCTVVTDIEIVCIPKRIAQTHDMFGNEIHDSYIRHPGFKKVVDQWVKVHGDAQNGKMMTRMIPLDYPAIPEPSVQLDIFTATIDSWGYIMVIRTGSADYSKEIATDWRRAGYHGDEGNLWDEGNNLIKVPTEETLFELIGRPYEPPHLR